MTTIIRGGTGNVFGKEAGVPRGVLEALRVLTLGEDYRFDLGRAGSRYFLLMSGIGFDASVVRRLPSRPKRFLGTTSYILWGAAAAMRFRGRPVDLLVDGHEETLDLYWLLIANTRSYGGVIDVASAALANDSWPSLTFVPFRSISFHRSIPGGYGGMNGTKRSPTLCPIHNRSLPVYFQYRKG